MVGTSARARPPMAHHTSRWHDRRAGLVGRRGRVEQPLRPSRLRRCLHVALTAIVLAEIIATGLVPLFLGGKP